MQASRSKGAMFNALSDLRIRISMTDNPVIISLEERNSGWIYGGHWKTRQTTTTRSFTPTFELQVLKRTWVDSHYNLLYIIFRIICTTLSHPCMRYGLYSYTPFRSVPTKLRCV